MVQIVPNCSFNTENTNNANTSNDYNDNIIYRFENTDLDNARDIMESVEVSEYPKDGNDDAMDLAEDLTNLQRL